MRKGIKSTKRKYPDDFLQDIRDMLAEGLYPRHVANYLGAPLWLAQYEQKQTGHRAMGWYNRNREYALKKQKEYRKRKRNGI